MRQGHIGRLVKETTGQSIIQLLKDEYGLAYENFNYRSRSGHIHVIDYLFLSMRTGLSFDDLIVDDPQYQKLKDKVAKILENQGLSVIEPTAPPPKPVEAPVVVEVQQKEEAIRPPLNSTVKHKRIGNRIMYL